MTVLQPASMTPEPTNRRLAPKLGIAHPLGVAFEVVRFDADRLRDDGRGSVDPAIRLQKLTRFSILPFVEFGADGAASIALMRRLVGMEQARRCSQRC